MGEQQEVLQEGYLRADHSARVPAEQSMRVYAAPSEHSVPWVLATCWMLSYLLRDWEFFQQAEVLYLPRIWISLHKFHTAKQLSGNLLRMRNWRSEEGQEGEKQCVHVCVCESVEIFFTRLYYFYGISFLTVLTFGCGGFWVSPCVPLETIFSGQNCFSISLQHCGYVFIS